jgi:acyl-coenzyme A synthetase/AMP-(fatty) acid ligase
MLYARWRKIAAERRNERALRDLASGRHWTFGDLLARGDTHSPGRPGLVFPQGHAPEFIFDLLAAWREGRVVCPLEPGQPVPDIAAPPAPCLHLKCTSGTGGLPRFVAFTPAQLIADADNIMATMGLRTDWPNLGVISMAHSYGFSNLVLPLLLQGVPLILVPAPLPEILRRAAAGEAALTLPAVPPMWRAWHQAAAIPASVRLAISAGAPLPLNVEQEIFQASGLKIHNFLGSSECGGIAYDATPVPRLDPSLAGRPMQNITVSLNAAGCLAVRSAAVGETYWPPRGGDGPSPDDGSHNLPRLTAGTFHSSDLAELRDGQVFLRGRLGDEINVAGRKVSPETIERALLAHPAVRECLVLGVPSRDAARTETLVAVVVSGAAETVLKQFLLQTLPAWQIPREWHFVPALTTTARGKISRAEWRRRFQATEPGTRP